MRATRFVECLGSEDHCRLQRSSTLILIPALNEQFIRRWNADAGKRETDMAKKVRLKKEEPVVPRVLFHGHDPRFLNRMLDILGRRRYRSNDTHPLIWLATVRDQELLVQIGGYHLTPPGEQGEHLYQLFLENGLYASWRWSRIWVSDEALTSAYAKEQTVDALADLVKRRLGPERYKDLKQRMKRIPFWDSLKETSR